MDDIPTKLIKAIAGRDALLFIGAGLSKGAGLPDWKGLFKPLLDQIKLPEERRVDLLQAAQDVETRCGRAVLLQHVIQATDTAGIAPTPAHRLLPDLGIDVWITTNYDNLLERALKETGHTCARVVRDPDLPRTSAGATTVLKLHGDREHPDTIILTRQDYDLFFSHSGLMRAKLRSLLAEKTVLFIGYGHNDQDVFRIWAEVSQALEGQRRPAYAVMYDLGEWERADLHARGIQVLDLQTKGEQVHTELLVALLGELVQQVQRARLTLRPLHQLPEPPADLIGREDELAELEAAVSAGGVAISGLRGMGGVGKTALALALAQRLAPRYPDAQLFLDLRGTGPDPLAPAEIMAHVIRAYHPAAQLPETEAELAPLYRSVLHGQRALLLLDNAAGPEQIAPLRCPGSCLLLITSRAHFSLPGLHALNLDELPLEDAEALLLRIAPRLGAPPLSPPRTTHGGEEEKCLPEREQDRRESAAPPPRETNRRLAGDRGGGLPPPPCVLDGGDRGGAVTELARLCGCLPLALDVTARRLADREDLDVGEYLARLRANRGRLPKVEAALRASYDLLDQALQARWRALAVFPASFDRAAAAAVWEVDEAPEGAGGAQEALSALLRYSLLAWDGAARRYRLHDLARECARAWLEGDQGEVARRRHAAHYERVLRAADQLYLGGEETLLQGLALYDLERENVAAGQAWAAARAGEDAGAAMLCIAYPDAGVYVLDLRLHARDHIRWLEAAAAAARAISDRESEGLRLGYLGLVYRHLGEMDKAIEYCSQALEIAQEIGDRRNEGNHLGNLGSAYRDLGEVDKAIDHYERALEIAVEIGDRRMEGNALGNLGLAYRDLGEVQKAVEYHQRALKISQEIGDRRGEGNHLGNLGIAYRALGEVQKAVEYHQRALEIAVEIGDRRGEGNHLGNLGNAYRALGEVEKAVEYHQRALKISQEIGDRRGEATHSWNLGLLVEERDPARAVALMSVCVAYERQIGHPDAERHAARVDQIRARLGGGEEDKR